MQSSERVIEVIDRALTTGSMQLSAHVSAIGVRKELVHFMALAQRVMGQTERRVFNEESVPAREKLVSIFQEHTDILVQNQRATISFRKRVFGLDRCTWRSLPSFKSYVWSSIVTFNLLVIARHELA